METEQHEKGQTMEKGKGNAEQLGFDSVLITCGKPHNF